MAKQNIFLMCNIILIDDFLDFFLIDYKLYVIGKIFSSLQIFIIRI